MQELGENPEAQLIMASAASLGMLGSSQKAHLEMWNSRTAGSPLTSATAQGHHQKGPDRGVPVTVITDGEAAISPLGHSHSS